MNWSMTFSGAKESRLEQQFHDRMTEENETEAPIEQICVDLCEKLIPEREIQCADPSAGFKWRETKAAFQVHNDKRIT